MIFDKQKTVRMLGHRFQSVETLTWAIHLRSKWVEAPNISVDIDGKLTLEGNLNAITNPMQEAGLVHCRALLEFLGLRDKSGSLVQITKRRYKDPDGDDIGVEHFGNTSGPLPKVSPENAVSGFGGDPAEAKKALLKVFQLTNKRLAHSTSEMSDDPADIKLIEIASRGVPALMISSFYRPLGLPRPARIISTRPRG